MRLFLCCIVVVVSFLMPSRAYSERASRFDLKDGDRIVLVGDTLIERDQRYGYLETFLTIANPDKTLIFRNLGWSGDTVGGISRSGFDPPAAGFEQLRQQIMAAKPTVVVVGYGMADSFAGEAGLAAFEQGLNRLLNAIASTKARVAMLSPVAHANLGPPLPDPADHNRDLARYRDAIRRVAKERSAAFIDLYEMFDVLYSTSPEHRPGNRGSLTDNGIQLTEDGYWGAALLISDQLAGGRAAASHLLVLTQAGKVIAEERTNAKQIEKTVDGLRFELVDSVLPLPFPGGRSVRTDTPLYPRRIEIQDLAPGKYELKIDGFRVAVVDSSGWKAGVTLKRGPEFEQVEALRAAINRKNELFFYRWRPQNNTYLLGFRKHEQGNNAVEIPRFDPLVAEQEAVIARLKKPVAHVYELSRVEKEVGR